MIVRYSYNPNTPLTPEQIKRLDALKDRPIVFDKACPEMTEEQLKPFRRGNPAEPNVIYLRACLTTFSGNSQLLQLFYCEKAL